MVILNKIYTRTGDDGSTGLGNGERRAKYDLRVAAYGSIDETNAALGVALLYLNSKTDDLCDAIAAIQNDLFDLGSDLAVPDDCDKKSREKLRITAAQVKKLETEIDRLNKQLAPLRSFILPGGSPASAHLHLARTICRRAEREMVELAADKNETVNVEALRYINRLSDFLFVAARIANQNGKNDVLWVPGKNR